MYKLLAQKKLEHGFVKVEESFSPNLSVTPVNPIYDGIDSAEILKQRLLEASKNVAADPKGLKFVEIFHFFFVGFC